MSRRAAAVLRAAPPPGRSPRRPCPTNRAGRRARRDGGAARHRHRRAPVVGGQHWYHEQSREPPRRLGGDGELRRATAPSSPACSCGGRPACGCACRVLDGHGVGRRGGRGPRAEPDARAAAPGAQPVLRRPHLRRPAAAAAGRRPGGAARHGGGGLRGQHRLRPALLARRAGRRGGGGRAGRDGGAPGAVLRLRLLGRRVRPWRVADQQFPGARRLRRATRAGAAPRSPRPWSRGPSPTRPGPSPKEAAACSTPGHPANSRSGSSRTRVCRVYAQSSADHGRVVLRRSAKEAV